MELIPILSLIILVATISTFILAVGAYILYKIRERTGQVSQAPQPATIPGELVAPAPLMAEQRYTQTGERRTYTEEQYPLRETGTEYQRQPMYMPSQERASTGPELRPTYISTPPPTSVRSTNSYSPQPTGGTRPEIYEPRPTPTSDKGTKSTSETDRYSGKRKFMRYTSEGYVEPSQENLKKEDSLKWR